ncbi:hypothetical protein, partial [Proteus faecis]|uniref:hypothetical protein n=1 Tax=Proteus faecis TaxID=2050967 RepID=UPI003075C2C8
MGRADQFPLTAPVHELTHESAIDELNHNRGNSTTRHAFPSHAKSDFGKKKLRYIQYQLGKGNLKRC